MGYTCVDKETNAVLVYDILIDIQQISDYYHLVNIRCHSFMNVLQKCVNDS